MGLECWLAQWRLLFHLIGVPGRQPTAIMDPAMHTNAQDLRCNVPPILEQAVRQVLIGPSECARIKKTCSWRHGHQAISCRSICGNCQGSGAGRYWAIFFSVIPCCWQIDHKRLFGPVNLPSAAHVSSWLRSYTDLSPAKKKKKKDFVKHKKRIFLCRCF